MSKPTLLRRALRKALNPLLWGYTSAEQQSGAIWFSQFGEDVMCNYLFAAGHRGFYVDVGAFHPMLLSNTYAFYRRGWRGIAIDANPAAAPLFARFRPEDAFIHSAIGQQQGTIEMAMFAESTFNCTADQMDQVPDHVRRTAKLMKVPIASLASILAERNVHQIDFLNVDCEGNDLNVLKSNDWSRWKPKAICVEDHEDNWLGSEIATYLGAFGYVLRNRAVFSSIYVLSKLSSGVQSGTRGCVPVA